MGKKSNIKGGNKHKKYAKEKEQVLKLNLYELDKTDDQEFAFVTKILGNKRCELKCFDNKTRIGLIRSSKRQMSKRKNWINTHAIVLISKRTFTTTDDKCDIIKLYAPEEISFLVLHKKITNNFVKSGSLQKDIDNTADIFSFDHDKTIDNKQNKKTSKNYDDVYMVSSDEDVVMTDNDNETNIDYTLYSKSTNNVNIDSI